MNGSHTGIITEHGRNTCSKSYDFSNPQNKILRSFLVETNCKLRVRQTDMLLAVQHKIAQLVNGIFSFRSLPADSQIRSHREPRMNTNRLTILNFDNLVEFEPEAVK
ncbi:hypothetical protein SDC9_192414 [bioreactor metagenome]|uniref:Uncharacterized protein n=1 Tax=bioreactor metagenome TaxID=1076179 RepID=A0A645I0P2_9ZZZZ